MDRGEKPPFALNRDSYATYFEPMYKKENLAPRTLVQFPVLLPFHVPVVYGTRLTMFLGDGIAHTYHFSTVEMVRDMNPNPGVATSKPIVLPVIRSRVEMICATTDVPIGTPGDYMTGYFDQLLTTLNHLLMAYLIFLKDVNVYRVTKEMLQPTCLTRVTNVENWQTTDGLFMLHVNVPYDRPALTEDQHLRLCWLAHVVRKELNPFVIAEELLLNARRT